jgi:hypothetical protein
MEKMTWAESIIKAKHPCDPNQDKRKRLTADYSVVSQENYIRIPAINSPVPKPEVEVKDFCTMHGFCVFKIFLVHSKSKGHKQIRVGIQMPNWTADACYSGLHRLFKN